MVGRGPHCVPFMVSHHSPLGPGYPRLQEEAGDCKGAWGTAGFPSDSRQTICLPMT